MQGITFLGLTNNAPLAVKDSTFTTIRLLGRDAKTIAGSKTARALGRVNRHTLATLASRSVRALRRLDRDTNIVSKLSTRRTLRFGIGVTGLSLGIIGHSGGTTWVFLWSTLASIPAGARLTARRGLGNAAGAIKDETGAAWRIGLVNANTSIKHTTIIAPRTLLGHTVGAVKVHALWTAWTILLGNTGGAIEDVSRLAIRTSSRNTVLAVERASGRAIWCHWRCAVVTVAVGTILTPRKIRILAVSTNKYWGIRTFRALLRGTVISSQDLARLAGRRMTRDTFLATNGWAWRTSRTLLNNAFFAVKDRTIVATGILRDKTLSISVCPRSAIWDRLNDTDLAVELASGGAIGLLQRGNPAPPLIIVGSWRAVTLVFSYHVTLLSVELEVLVTTSRFSSGIIGREIGANLTSGPTFRRTHSPPQVEAGWAGRFVFTDLAIEESGLTIRGLLRYTSRTIKVGSNRAVRLGLMSTNIVLHDVPGRAWRRRFANAVTVRKFCVGRARRGLGTNTAPVLKFERRGTPGRDTWSTKPVLESKSRRACRSSEGNANTAVILEAMNTSRSSIRFTGFAIEPASRRTSRRRADAVSTIVNKTFWATRWFLADAVVAIKIGTFRAHWRLRENAAGAVVDSSNGTATMVSSRILRRDNLAQIDGPVWASGRDVEPLVSTILAKHGR
jgi:hypothetical protein